MYWDWLRDRKILRWIDEGLKGIENEVFKKIEVNLKRIDVNLD